MTTGGKHPTRFGRYEVEGVLGKGAMGIVYLARDPAINRKVAIKVLHARTGLDDDERAAMRERFEREVRSAGTLSHPYVVTVYDVGEEDGHAYLAMEFVDGSSLDSRISSELDFTLEQVAEVIDKTAAALDYAHARRIVHRDIKPGNILLTPAGEPKVTDFGVAKLTNLDMTTTGTIVGTPKYMAPEQIMGRQVGPATDQWALAVVAFEMLTGGLPFEGDNPTTMMYHVVHDEPPPPRSLNAELPAAIDRVLLQALSKNPENRFPSCTDFAHALRKGLRTVLDDISDQETKLHDLSAGSTAILESGDLVDLELGSPTSTPEKPSTAKSLPAKPQTAKGRGVGTWVAIAAVVTALGAVGWSYFRDAPTSDPGWTGTMQVASEPAGAAIWVDGVDSGLVTPASVPLQGAEGDNVGLQLRQGDETLATTQVVLGSALEPWQPDLGPRPRRLSIVSEPRGAQVSLDGEVVGRAGEVRVDVEAEQTYELQLELEGYEPASRTVSLDDLSTEEAATGTLAFSLNEKPPSGTVHIVADYPVTVEAAGQRQSGPTVELPAGTHAAVLSAPEVFYRGRRTLEVRSGESVEVSLPEAVAITVAAAPSNCQVTIDGRDIGFVPVQVRVAVGPHTFGFRWQGVAEVVEVSEEVTPETTRIFQVAPESS